MNPYLSFVMVGRNDNYGGDFLERMQMSVDSILSLSRRHSLSAELVIVEWNPPENRPTLDTALDWPKVSNQQIRIVRVPRKVHDRLPNSDAIPVFEYIGKNVGIRRSNGDFVLSTNPDIIYNSEMIEYFSGENLSDSDFYRANRHDVKNIDYEYKSVDDLLTFCNNNIFKVSSPKGGYETIDTITRFKNKITELTRTVISDPSKVTSLIKNPWLVLTIPREVLPATDQDKSPTEGKGTKQNVSLSGIQEMYLTASGDFLMMSKESWFEIKGYPELNTNLHVDTLGCVLAAANGLTQTILQDPLRIYHREHDRSERKQRPSKSSKEIREIGDEIWNADGFADHNIVNDEGWGFKGSDIIDITVIK